MIKINDDYSIDSDADCVTVYRAVVGKKGKSKGKVYLRPYKYFPTLKSALYVLVDIVAQDEGLQSVQFVADKIEQLRVDLFKAIGVEYNGTPR